MVLRGLAAKLDHYSALELLSTWVWSLGSDGVGGDVVNIISYHYSVIGDRKLLYTRFQLISIPASSPFCILCNLFQLTPSDSIIVIIISH